MRKPKQRQLAGKPTKKNKKARGGLLDFSNTVNSADVHGEDGWVIVKKQRVTILVPPLPVTKKATMPKPASSQLQVVPKKVADSEPQVPVDTCPSMPSVNEQEESTLLGPRKDSQIATKSPAQHIPELAKSPRLEFRIESENPDWFDSSRLHTIHGVSNTTKTIKRPRLICGPSLVDGNTLLNKRLRASVLERKLQKAGGLNRWLASLGLGQFVRIFHSKSINKFQLVNLTMQKLKDMGAVAVGPRRKLMHAIDCVCQPYCFEAS